MEVTIVVSGNNQFANIDTNAGKSADETLSLVMVPPKYMDLHVSNIENKEVSVPDQHTFNDLRKSDKYGI